jgi:type II secretory pathway pseudopilin PulG
VLERPGLDAVGDRVGSAHARFTIIEVLVVVAILALLAAVMVFVVADRGDNAQSSVCHAERARVENAIEAYRDETGAYPRAMGDLLMEPTRFLRFLPTYYVLAADRESGRIEGTGPCAEK